jgi:hypothetical protein
MRLGSWKHSVVPDQTRAVDHVEDRLEGSDRDSQVTPGEAVKQTADEEHTAIAVYGACTASFHTHVLTAAAQDSCFDLFSAMHRAVDTQRI